jgi:protein-tyrosine kinase
LHTILGAPQEPGLTDYLTGHTALESLLQQMQLPESGPLNRSFGSLTFMPSGPDAENAADLSGNGRFELLLRAVYDQFDWIIIDSSPVTLVADGVNLARACDGVVLVTRAGQTRYEVAQRAQQELKASKIVGVVLNAVEETPQLGGYYGYDG